MMLIIDFKDLNTNDENKNKFIKIYLICHDAEKFDLKKVFNKGCLFFLSYNM